MTNQNLAIDQMLRWPEIHKITGLARNTVHSMARQGRFPKPLKLSANGRASGWLLSEIQIWQQDRLAARDTFEA